jgi:hypothetical protein
VIEGHKKDDYPYHAGNAPHNIRRRPTTDNMSRNPTQHGGEHNRNGDKLAT